MRTDRTGSRSRRLFVSLPEANGVMPASSDDVPMLLVVDDNADLRRVRPSAFRVALPASKRRHGADAYERARTPAGSRHQRRDDARHRRPCILRDAARKSGDRFHPGDSPYRAGRARAAVAGLGRGADDYIVKPFDMRELEARVENLIASRRPPPRAVRQPARGGASAPAAPGPVPRRPGARGPAARDDRRALRRAGVQRESSPGSSSTIARICSVAPASFWVRRRQISSGGCGSNGRPAFSTKATERGRGGIWRGV